jgi:hypothetical protein
VPNGAWCSDGARTTAIHQAIESLAKFLNVKLQLP